MNKIHISLIYILLLFLIFPFVFAETVSEEDGDLEIFDLEVEKLLNLGSGILATALCFLTINAYNKTKRSRLLWVSIAFGLFAIKGYITAIELFGIEWSWIDPTASLLNFGILLAFFAGLLKK